jgi:hypothetical protein
VPWLTVAFPLYVTSPPGIVAETIFVGDEKVTGKASGFTALIVIV